MIAWRHITIQRSIKPHWRWCGQLRNIAIKDNRLVSCCHGEWGQLVTAIPFSRYIICDVGPLSGAGPWTEQVTGARLQSRLPGIATSQPSLLPSPRNYICSATITGYSEVIRSPTHSRTEAIAYPTYSL